MEVFQSVRDEDVISFIKRATSRLVFLAPGVSVDVSNALIACIAARSIDRMVIVLDADEDACRLGYCDASALAALSSAATRYGLEIRHQPGVRLGLLMADEEVLVWAPTPLMFEAPRGAAETNGMHLTPQTLNSLPAALGVDPEESIEDAEIGGSTLPPADIAATVAAIKAAPPAPFDVTRLARVFSAKFQFIETLLRGAELTKREMRLDSLIVNSDAPAELQSLLHTTIQPFSTDADKAVDVPILINGEQVYNKAGIALNKPATQAEIRSYWSALANRYIVNLPGFGKIIRQTDKLHFEEGKAAYEIVLKAWVDGFQKLVKNDHETRVGHVTGLIEQRMSRAEHGKKMTRAAIETLVRAGLDNLRVIEPSVKVVFKNITAESTRDKEFLTALRKAMPEKELTNWFQIYDAAPMRQPDLI